MKLVFVSSPLFLGDIECLGIYDENDSSITVVNNLLFHRKILVILHELCHYVADKITFEMSTFEKLNDLIDDIDGKIPFV